MGWASEVIDSPNGNALLRFCFISESVPEPDSIFKPCFLILIRVSRLHPTHVKAMGGFYAPFYKYLKKDKSVGFYVKIFNFLSIYL